MTEKRKKRRGFRWWAPRIAIVLVATAVVLHWPCRVEIEIGPATTVITGPVNDDGTVNYVAYLDALAAEGVTPANNAAVGLIKAFGPGAFPDSVRAEALAKLGLEEMPAETDGFVRVEDWSAGDVDVLAEGDDPGPLDLKEQLDQARKGPWREADFPDVAGYLAANAAALGKVVAAARRPRYYVPILTETDPPHVLNVATEHYGYLREAGTALAARAMLRLRQGRPDAAWTDIHAVWRMSRLLSDGRTILRCMVGVGLENLAADGASALAVTGSLTPEQVRTMLADLGALRPPGKIAAAFDQGERFYLLDTVMTMYRGSSLTAIVKYEDRRGRPLDLDWNLMLREVNHWCDRSAAAAGMPTAAQRRAAFDAYSDAIADMARGRLWLQAKGVIGAVGGWPCRGMYTRAKADLFLTFMAFGLGRVVELRDEVATKAALARLALALAAHKAEKGSWPEDLAALSPAYLKTVPLDPFTGKPLIYQPAADGYLLYGVGPNFTDDGGEHDPPEADDIAVAAGPEPPSSSAEDHHPPGAGLAVGGASGGAVGILHPRTIRRAGSYGTRAGGVSNSAHGTLPVGGGAACRITGYRLRVTGPSPVPGSRLLVPLHPGRVRAAR